MDPALVNWALHSAGRDTVRIVGDNLIKQPFVEDLMRLNKAFVGATSVAPVNWPSRKPVVRLHWPLIARRAGANLDRAEEGRAKDGVDQTDPAIIKMIKWRAASIPMAWPAI